MKPVVDALVVRRAGAQESNLQWDEALLPRCPTYECKTL